MANPYLEAFRASGGGPSGSNTPAPKTTTNSRLAAFRSTLPQQQADDQKKQQEDQQKQQAQQKAATDKAKQDQQNKPWYQKGFEGVAKAFTTDLGKNVGDILGVGKDMVTGAIDSGAKIAQQSRISGQVQAKNGNTPIVGDNFAKNQNAEIDRALKAGEINQQKANDLRAKTAKAVTTTKQSIGSAEKNVGVKYDPSAGVEGLIDTATNFTGLGELGAVGKVLFKKAVETASKRLGRKLTADEATNLVEQTKKVVPDAHASEVGSVPAPVVPKAESTTLPVKTATTPAKTPNMRQFEYTDTGPMTDGEKKALTELDSNRVNTENTSATNELRQLSKESGQPELYKKVMKQVSDQNMSQEEATKFIKQGLSQMRDSGTIAKIKGAEIQTVPSTAPHPMQEPIFQAARVQAEKRLGRELKPAEIEKLTADTKKVVEEKMPRKVVQPEKTSISTDINRQRAENELYDLQHKHADVHVQDIPSSDIARAQELRNIIDGSQASPKPKSPTTVKSVEEKMPLKDILPDKPPTSKQELKTAIDAHLYETHPHLFNPKETGRVFNETGTGDIPSMHVNDLKRYFGRTEDIPAIYKRTTGPEDLDQLAQRAGYDDIDKYVADIQSELEARSHSRNATKELAALRKDPEVIATAQKALDEEKARYGTDQPYQPSKKDMREYTKLLHGDDAKLKPNPEQMSPQELPKDYKGNRQMRGDTQSGNSVRLEQNALEKKLTDNFGDLASYKSINMKEQAEKATKLINDDRQKAIDIIDGKANPPGNLKEQSIHQALEEAAVREGDVGLLQKLAKSHVNTELSESAQNLRIAAERDPHSAVENIRQIQELRKQMAEKRFKTTVGSHAADIEKKINAVTPKATKQDWASFVKELTC